MVVIVLVVVKIKILSLEEDISALIAPIWIHVNNVFPSIFSNTLIIVLC